MTRPASLPNHLTPRAALSGVPAGCAEHPDPNALPLDRLCLGNRPRAAAPTVASGPHPPVPRVAATACVPTRVEVLAPQGDLILEICAGHSPQDAFVQYQVNRAYVVAASDFLANMHDLVNPPPMSIIPIHHPDVTVAGLGVFLRALHGETPRVAYEQVMHIWRAMDFIGAHGDAVDIVQRGMVAAVETRLRLDPTLAVMLWETFRDVDVQQFLLPTIIRHLPPSHFAAAVPCLLARDAVKALLNSPGLSHDQVDVVAVAMAWADKRKPQGVSIAQFLQAAELFSCADWWTAPPQVRSGYLEHGLLPEAIKFHVGDIDRTVRELLARIRWTPADNESRDFLATPDVEQVKAGLARGPVLLYGPSGSGKTALMREVARQLMNQNPAHQVLLLQDTDLHCKWVGYGAGQARALRQYLEAHNPCTLLLDEVDALFPSRERDGSLTNALLNLITVPNTSIMMATNVPWRLEPDIDRCISTRLFAQCDAAVKVHMLRSGLRACNVTFTDFAEADIPKFVDAYLANASYFDVDRTIRSWKDSLTGQIHAASHFVEDVDGSLVPCTADTPNALSGDWWHLWMRGYKKFKPPTSTAADLRQSIFLTRRRDDETALFDAYTRQLVG